jgi:glycosyltransferase involved in cell wall biosynthesis
MNRPIKVLHVVVNMNRGGAESLIMNLYRSVDRARVQFDFLTCKEGAFDAEIAALGGTIHRIPYLTEAGHFGYVKALRHFFADHAGEYAIVHAHMDKMSGFVLREAKRGGIPFRIAHSHSTKSEGGVPAQAYKWYAGRFIASCATHMLACSQQAAEWLFRAGREQPVIVKNGVESRKYAYSPDVRRSVREELELGEDRFVVGHVGRFSPPKNHSFLLEMFARFQRDVPNAALVLAGDGALRPQLAKQAAELGIAGAVTMLGVRPDVNRLLQAFDAFAFPSLYEGLPVTLIEAQAGGLPCLVSERITREVDLGLNLLRFLPIDRTERWVESLRELAGAKGKAADAARCIPAEYVAKQGYDIRHTASWLENFYLALSR